MITERQPEAWRELQNEVARILTECGMQSEVEKTVTLARGAAEIDVVAVETNQGRSNTIFCECKFWKSSIPQTVIHAFRTTVADGGANVGYVITSSAFQRGAVSAADLTNLRLVTWQQFQAEFESTWIERHLRPEVTRRLDELMELVEPLVPNAFVRLSEPAKAKYLELRGKYYDLGAIAMLFTSYMAFLEPSLPELPLRDRWKPSSNTARIPSGLLDATAYRDFLDILLPFGEEAAAQLKGVLYPEAASSSSHPV
jgi:restriction system protein